MSLFAGEERKAEIAGALVLVGAAAAVAFVLFFADALHFGGHVRARVDFDQVAGLGDGAAVMVAGRTVGRVESITLEAHGVAAYVRIDDSKRDMVPVNGDFFVSSRGLLSERYLEVGPPPGGVAPGRPIADGDRVHGSSAPSLDRSIQRTWDNLERTRAFFADVGPQATELFAQLGALDDTLAQLDPGPAGWAGLAAKWRASLDQARASWAALQQSGADPAHVLALAASAAQTMVAARQALALVRARATFVSGALDRTLARAKAGTADLERLRAALAGFDAISAKLDHALATAQGLAASLARGEGTLGKLQSDPEFPEDAKELGKILKRHPWKIIGRPLDKP